MLPSLCISFLSKVIMCQLNMDEVRTSLVQVGTCISIVLHVCGTSRLLIQCMTCVCKTCLNYDMRQLYCITKKILAVQYPLLYNNYNYVSGVHCSNPTHTSISSRGPAYLPHFLSIAPLGLQSRVILTCFIHVTTAVSSMCITADCLSGAIRAVSVSTAGGRTALPW